MSAQIFRLVGGAGTGKTTELMRLMGKVMQHGVDDPFKIGFVSFTRAARLEASTRAAKAFDVDSSELEQRGWFRTLHSVCYRALEIDSKRLLSDNAESREWLRSEVSKHLAGPPGENGDEPGGSPPTAHDHALRLWQAARATLTSMGDTHAAFARNDAQTPSLSLCVDIAKKYEQAKLLDNRVDFTDILGEFAGIRFDPEHGPSETTPRGDVPGLPVWFFDEQQDASALLDRVCRRLVSSPAVKFAYVVGDPFQSIFGFAGASSRYFMGWPVTKERVMPKSYRCPGPILDLGERVLRQCSDYWDRGIAPADHEGAIRQAYSIDAFVKDLDPRDDWLLIARTNYLASMFSRALDACGIPWVGTHGGGSWAAPVRNTAAAAMQHLQAGNPISGSEWATCLKYLPTSVDGEKLLERGVKAKWEAEPQIADQYEWLQLPDLIDLGATDSLIWKIASGQWANLGKLKGSDRYVSACSRFGKEATDNPGIRVGTIHSVKGAEADNVCMMTCLSNRTHQAIQRSTETSDEEHRIAYVGVTRARKTLTLLRAGSRFPMRIPPV